MLASAFTKVLAGPPRCTASTEHRGGTPVGYFGYSQHTPCDIALYVSGAEQPDGIRDVRLLRAY